MTHKQVERLLSGCAKACLIILLLFMAGIIVIVIGLNIGYQNMVNTQLAVVDNHRIQWESQQIESYILTIEEFPGPGSLYQITIIVFNGKVVEVFDHRFNQYQSHPRLEGYSRYTIESILDRAETCFQFCIVQHYSDHYGFPEVIQAGFIESSGFWIIDFQPLSSE